MQITDLTLSLAIASCALPPTSIIPYATPLDGEPLPLAAVWVLSREAEPGYSAAREAAAAEMAARNAVGRERLPVLALEAAGDQGQRARPGEERAIGVGARGDVRAIAGWTILDSSQGWRETERQRRVEEMRWAGEVFDADFRAAVGRVYLDVATEEARRLVVAAHRVDVAELARVIGLRREAGVEIEYDAFLIEEALARYDRRLAEATHRSEAAQAELAMLAGRCVRPTGLRPRPPPLPAHSVATDANPRVRLLRERAAAQAAAAGAVRRQDLWRLQILGATGPYFSEAFADGPVEPEYIVGVSASWNPDLAGIRRTRAAAEAARARAVQHEAASEQRAVERELARLTVSWARFDERRRELDRELELTQRRANAAGLRWMAGVDRWREVVDAQERLLEVRLAQLELEREIALALIAYGERAGELDSLPSWLGQESAP
jgi:outer membrane protein TolC